MSNVHNDIPEITSFEFDENSKALAIKEIAKYPVDRKQSAVMALLHIVQKQTGGWLPRVAMDYVAQYLEMAPIRVYEVASFYTMYNFAPVGKNYIQVCTTTPCWLRGSADIVETCKKELGIDLKENTKDGLFTLGEGECLGACANAPVVRINDDYYEDLTPEIMKDIINKLRAGEKVKCGSQIGRQCSAPIKENS
jgi:NADH-quinone oxidoreductase subunit E